MHGNGPYWRDEQSGLLYDPRTDMIESRPGGPWVPLGTPQPREDRGFDPWRVTPEERERQRQYDRERDEAERRYKVTPEERERDREYEREKEAAERRYRDDQARYTRDRAEAEARAREAASSADRAEDARQFDAAQRWKETEQQWTEKKDQLDRAWKQREFDYKRESDALDRAHLEGVALGEIGGRPTLDAQRLALDRQKYEDELRNSPQNFYNYIFRSAGMEPPVLPGRPAAAAPPIGPGPSMPPGASTVAQRADLAADYGPGGMDIPGLKAKYSATELARLPLDVLAQFSNEDLMAIGQQYHGGLDAFLRLLPRERIAGSGTWTSRNTGFGLDVQDRLYGPSGNLPLAQAPSFGHAPSLGPTPVAGGPTGPTSPVVPGAPGGPLGQDALAELERRRREAEAENQEQEF